MVRHSSLFVSFMLLLCIEIQVSNGSRKFLTGLIIGTLLAKNGQYPSYPSYPPPYPSGGGGSGSQQPLLIIIPTGAGGGKGSSSKQYQPPMNYHPEPGGYPAESPTSYVDRASQRRIAVRSKRRGRLNLQPNLISHIFEPKIRHPLISDPSMIGHPSMNYPQRDLGAAISPNIVAMRRMAPEKSNKRSIITKSKIRSEHNDTKGDKSSIKMKL